MRLGIDFGTTRTVVSAALDGRYPVASFDLGDRDSDYLRGLAVWADGRLHFGPDAEALLAASERGTDGEVIAVVRSIKRAISALDPDERVPALRGAPVTALELATAYLRWVHDMIRARSNLEIADDEALIATIAVPASASTRQRYMTLEAFRQAGFVLAGLINEPTAGAIEYARRHLKGVGARSPKRYVVIYDLGGGTFDAAAVSLVGRRFELLCSTGVANLGGDDFDERILELALERRPPDAAAPGEAARAMLLEACREAKERLGRNSRRVLIEPGGAEGDASWVLDTQDVYARCRPLIDATLDATARLFETLRAHGIDPESSRELGGLYLVGGATAFPAVARALRRQYGRKILLSLQPHAATAVGLAVAGDPAAGVLVREATTRHFGVWREREGGRTKVFDPIFRRDALTHFEPSATRDDDNDDDDVVAAAAVVARRRYRPAHAVGHLRFLECSSLCADDQPEGELTPWREIVFPYDPILVDHPDLANCPVAPRPDAPADDVVETYLYRRDGTIALQIENATRGYQRTFVLGALELAPQ